MKSLFRLVQFVGRSVRGVTDYAETYVLDSGAKYMVQDYGKKRSYVPYWFYNACRFNARLD